MAAESSSYVTLETLVCTFIWQKERERERKKEREMFLFGHYSLEHVIFDFSFQEFHFDQGIYNMLDQGIYKNFSSGKGRGLSVRYIKI